MNEKSETTPTPTSSNSLLPEDTSSPTTSGLPYNPIGPWDENEEFMTAPLEGLCPHPVHLMTEEEVRNHVMKNQQYRQSYQTFKAEVERNEEDKVRVKRTRPQQKITSSGIDDLLA
jgi:hypothetical protein